MRGNLLIVSLFILSGCSTLKQSMTTASIIGGIAGGIAGGILSPNKPSILPNVVLFGALGAVAGGASAYYLHKSDPENWPLKPMMLESDQLQSNYSESPKENAGFNPILKLSQSKKYLVPTEPLPNELMGKVKKQYILEYESPEQTLQLEDKTLIIPPFKAWEHAYE
jgi:uncharacterized membrane protein YeaQ/YmgE (transglycosylase-associated protein family)